MNRLKDLREKKRNFYKKTCGTGRHFPYSNFKN